MIGNDVTITLIEIRGQKVRIGIDAPRSLPIYRQELLPLKEADQSRAE